MSTKNYYKRLVADCNEDLKFLRNYLSRENREDSYITFIEQKENAIEFKIGNRRILLSYLIDLKNLKRFYKTQEIARNENDYGRFKLIEIPELHFNTISQDGGFVDKEGDTIVFPSMYLKRLETHLELL